MLRLIAIEHGRCGVLRTYQHPRLGRLEIVTLPGKNGSSDVIHIQHVREIMRTQLDKRRKANNRSGGAA